MAILGRNFERHATVAGALQNAQEYFDIPASDAVLPAFIGIECMAPSSFCNNKYNCVDLIDIFLPAIKSPSALQPDQTKVPLQAATRSISLKPPPPSRSSVLPDAAIVDRKQRHIMREIGILAQTLRLAVDDQPAPLMADAEHHVLALPENVADEHKLAVFHGMLASRSTVYFAIA